MMFGDKISRFRCFEILCLVASHICYAFSSDLDQTWDVPEPFARKNISKSRENIANLITREEWGALPPRIWPGLIRLQHPVPFVLVSYFTPDISDDKMALQAIQRKHQMAGQPDIQSNFLIGGDGKIFEGRGWFVKPAKSMELPEYDGKFIEISYIGDFNNEDHKHPIFNATWEVLEFGRNHKYLDENFQILSNKK